ncbi:MAG: hypothetical protein LBF32_00455 [Streptococcaceae bacterium]|jgi:hypothetical protein|nr:hypothetical protein [Streptococcaceae bacterium]
MKELISKKRMYKRKKFWVIGAGTLFNMGLMFLTSNIVNALTPDEIISQHQDRLLNCLYSHNRDGFVQEMNAVIQEIRSDGQNAELTSKLPLKFINEGEKNNWESLLNSLKQFISILKSDATLMNTLQKIQNTIISQSAISKMSLLAIQALNTAIQNSKDLSEPLKKLDVVDAGEEALGINSNKENLIQAILSKLTNEGTEKKKADDIKDHRLRQALTDNERKQRVKEYFGSLKQEEQIQSITHSINQLTVFATEDIEKLTGDIGILRPNGTITDYLGQEIGHWEHTGNILNLRGYESNLKLWGDLTAEELADVEPALRTCLRSP